jgi:TRAP-type C4-dicarboxylate transport system permease small subunit
LEAPTVKSTYPKTAFDRLIDALAGIAGITMITLVVLVCADVAVRNAPDIVPQLLSVFLSDAGTESVRKALQATSLPWIPELNEYLLYIITFLGAPWVLRDQGHIAVDLVTQSLSRQKKQKVAFVTHIIGAIVCLILCYYSVRVILRSYAANANVVKTWTFPEWWPMAIAPPIFLLLAIIFLRWLVKPPQVDTGGTLGDGV